jgi:hypothetical protein
LGQVWATTPLADAVAGATILAVSILETLRAELELARGAGETFDSAWPASSAAALKRLARAAPCATTGAPRSSRPPGRGARPSRGRRRHGPSARPECLREREWTPRARTVSGDPYENQCAAVFRVRDGRIASVRDYLHTLYASEVAFTTARGGQPYLKDSGCP